MPSFLQLKVVFQLQFLGRSLLFIMVNHKLGIVPNRKEPVTSEHIERKGYQFSSHDTSQGIQVSSYGD